MRNSVLRILLLLSAITFWSAGSALATSIFELSCSNEWCNFRARVGFGGGFLYDQITGYCVRDEQFVQLTWKRGERAPDPVRVLNPQIGALIELYRCPKCRDPFLPIKSVGELKYCPKCHQAALKYRLALILD
jgi:hypothetical protein